MIKLLTNCTVLGSLIVHFAHCSLLAQTTPDFVPSHENIIPPSPETADLGKFSDINVNYHSGTPDVSIPVHTIDGKNLSHAISLRYDASGRKVSEIAGPAGWGWTLQASGVITRTVRGLPDELVNGQYWGYFATYEAWKTIHEPWFEGPNYDPANTLHPSNIFMGHVYTNVKDLLPDAFNFNFDGYSGKIMFKMDENNGFKITPVVIPHQGLKVERSFYNNGTGSIYNLQDDSWTITTPDGKVYQFSRNDAEITQSNGTAGTFISAWHLSSISDRNQTESINFLYQSINDNEPLNNYQVYNTVFDLVTPPSTHDIECQPLNPAALSYDDTDVLRTKYLYLIKYKNQTVHFLSSFDRLDEDPTFTPKLRKLSKIQVLEGEITNPVGVIKDINFQFSYFGSSEKRLRLDELSLGSHQPPYRFEYGAGEVPDYQSYAKDHWGYYNGTNNTSLIPTIPEEYANGGMFANNPLATANRGTSAQHGLGSLLKKVTYPTGGTAEYTYEPHIRHEVEVNCTEYPREELTAFGGPNFGSMSVLEQALRNMIDNGDTQIGSSGLPNVRAINFTVENQNVELTSSLTLGNYQFPTGTYLIEAPLTQTTWGNRITLPEGQTRMGLASGSYILAAMVGENLDGVYATASVSYWKTHPQCEVNEVIGGARIKKIKLYDGVSHDNDLIEDYYYLNNAQNYIEDLELGNIPPHPHANTTSYGSTSNVMESSIRLHQRPVYYKMMRCNILYASAFNIDPFAKDLGSHVGYSEVAVVKRGRENGLSIYKYQNGANPNTRSNLVNEVHYRYDGVGAFTKVQETTWDYSLLYGQYITGYKFDITDVKLKGCLSINPTSCEYYPVYNVGIGSSAYNYSSSGSYLNNQTQTFYNNNGSNTTTTAYFYDFSQNTGLISTGIEIGLPTRIESTSSLSDLKTYKKYYYPYSFDAAIDPAIDQLKDDYVINKKIGEEVGIIDNGTYKKTYEQLAIPRLQNTMVVDDKIYHLQLAEPENSNSTYLKSILIDDPNKYRLVREFDYQDSNDSPAFSKSIDGVETTYIWGYDNTYPVAKVLNATYDEVINALNVTHEFLQGLEGQALLNELGILRTALPDARVTIYTYKPYVGISSVTDPNGLMHEFIYDSFGRLEAVKEKDGNGNINLVRSLDYHYGSQNATLPTN